MQTGHEQRQQPGWVFASRDEKLVATGLALTVPATFVYAWSNPSTASAALVLVSLVLFALMYLGVIQRRSISSKYLKLEERAEHLETETKELKKVSEALLRSMYVALNVADKPFMGGPSPDHYALIERYIDPIRGYLSEDILLRVAHDMESMPKLSEDEADRIARMTIAERMREAERKKPAGG